MNRAVVVAIAAAILLSGAAVRSESTGAMIRMGDVDQILTISRGSTVHSLRDPGHVASQQCCKICRQGKACGDTCISRQDTCHVGQGCACDG
jgi:hypothetical protein